jgi:hypothetical protein
MVGSWRISSLAVMAVRVLSVVVRRRRDFMVEVVGLCGGLVVGLS